MPPKGYKNLPSIKKALFLDFVEIAKSKDKSISQLLHEVLGAFVSLAKGDLPVEEWQKV
ncbi:MAG: hypothetical protein OEX09_02000 [Candidatus Bathyarchaeota archaeon]|nr:hypothetical protein [Candidatus Bathyarchaeota archaeon]